MAIAALVLFVVFLLLSGLVRGWIQARRTGDHGDRRAAARQNPVQRRIDAVAAVGALGVGVVAPVAAATGLDAPGFAYRPLVQACGLAVAVIGIAGTFAAQSAMGASWRAGVDPAERTELVTSGLFTIVRNPVITGVFVFCAGLALMTANVVGAVAFAAVLAANQALIRLVEEPHLLRVHGAAYRAYAARTGRFVPDVGRLRR
ncbi:protein-S-isoprenylcysteine O-methyltransferase Ste14 [Murinocardiopsis flavida]|uniref:Protein-S-isoprenylcysteine O-methyltransferase Ste14 n=1 Tax=Murinocardiopsis flavida TaxID=645275 RepID=A0A2P8DH13_9ACTN|nr:methyltransferase [Murinocardiopsis flavida]PSK96512.1 protein-S-isoprenylcysteine O-methyltransferase Ste14 [Murinocardiopsis flavida]